ncbi:hypothetical protein WJX84_007294, partial [Apatococcus fuscideae]
FLQFCSAGLNSVTGIFLPGANLLGQLPDTLFDGLPDLQQLNLESNPNLTGAIPAAPSSISAKLQFFSVAGSSLSQCPVNQSSVFAFNASCYPSFISASPMALVPAQMGMQCPAVAFNRSGSNSNILLQVLQQVDPQVYQQLQALINASTISNSQQIGPPGGASPSLQGPPNSAPGGNGGMPGGPFGPASGTLVECVAAAAATTKSNGIQAWEVAVPATLGTLVLLAAFAAVIKFAPGVLDDMALLRMLNLKRGSPAGLMKPAAAQNLGLTPGEITLVITDLQGSTELWEWNSAVMDVANALHAQLARRLLKKYCGYEVLTEGDSFTLAFHDCLDAVGFTHHFQEALLGLDWPPELLLQPAAAVVSIETPVQCILFRGLRVRVGIHTGIPEQIVHHPAGGHLQYAGSIITEANAIANLGHGGQVLMSLQSRQSLASRISSSLGIRMARYMQRALRADAMPFTKTTLAAPQMSGQVSAVASFSGASTAMLVQPAASSHQGRLGEETLMRTLTGSGEGSTALAAANDIGADRLHNKKKGRRKRNKADKDTAYVYVDMGVVSMDPPDIGGHEAGRGMLLGLQVQQLLAGSLVHRFSHFPPASHRSLVAPTFLDAPCAQLALIGSMPAASGRPHKGTYRVTLCFCKPDGMKERFSGHHAAAKEALMRFQSCVRTLLQLAGGMECQENMQGEFMLAFQDPRQAVEWALMLQEALLKLPMPQLEKKHRHALPAPPEPMEGPLYWHHKCKGSKSHECGNTAWADHNRGVSCDSPHGAMATR